METKIKFRYRVKDLKDNRIITYYKTIEEVEGGLIVLNNDTYLVLSRDIFTGLKDKNDKEIYEGDIVNGNYESNKISYPVIWHNSGWYSGYWEEDKKNITCLYAIENIEVIGNIYG